MSSTSDKLARVRRPSLRTLDSPSLPWSKPFGTSPIGNEVWCQIRVLAKFVIHTHRSYKSTPPPPLGALWCSTSVITEEMKYDAEFVIHGHRSCNPLPTRLHSFTSKLCLVSAEQWRESVRECHEFASDKLARVRRDGELQVRRPSQRLLARVRRVECVVATCQCALELTVFFSFL